VLPAGYVRQAVALARARGLATHLDGARVCNAAVKQGVSVREACAGFDSASVCLSKGLGAPVGSLLLGSRAFIDQAKRWRKMLGGAMRQAGIVAAAGIYALEHNIERLAEDHANATALADGLRALGLGVSTPQTNIVYIELPAERCAALAEHLAARRVRASVAPHMRVVTHLDVSAQDVAHVVDSFRAFFQP
jgi:threonine aldolase